MDELSSENVIVVEPRMSLCEGALLQLPRPYSTCQPFRATSYCTVQDELMGRTVRGEVVRFDTMGNIPICATAAKHSFNVDTCVTVDAHV